MSSNPRPPHAMARIAAQNARRDAQLSPRATIHAQRFLRWRLGADPDRPAPPATWTPEIAAVVERHADAALHALEQHVTVGLPKAPAAVTRLADRRPARPTANGVA